MPPVFKPPDTPLGNFVRQNYAPNIRGSVFRKLKRKGFTPPSASSPRSTSTFETPDTPLGRFVSENYAPRLQGSAFRTLTKRTRAGTFSIPDSFKDTPEERRLSLLPREFIGREGVVGPFKAQPRLPDSEWVFAVNDRGRFFAARRDELEGLTPDQRFQVGVFDRRGSARRTQVDQSYDRLSENLGTQQTETRDQLASLGSLIGADSPEAFQAAREADPHAGAAQDIQSQINESRGTQAATDAALAVGQVADRRTFAENERAIALADIDSRLEASRAELVEAYRTNNQERAQAAAERALEEQMRRDELNLQLRGQEIDLLSTRIQERGRNTRADVESADRAADRLADIQTTRAKLENQLVIARLNGQVRLEAQIQSDIAALEREEHRTARESGKERNRRGRQRNAAYREWVGEVEEAVREDPDAVSTTDVLSGGLTRGFTPGQVVKVLRQHFGDFGRGSSADAFADRNDLYRALLSSGVKQRRARRIVKNLTGRFPGAGPARP